MFVIQAMVCGSYNLCTNCFTYKKKELFQLLMWLEIVECGALFFKIYNHQSILVLKNVKTWQYFLSTRSKHELLASLWDGLKRKGDGNAIIHVVNERDLKWEA